MPTICGEGSLEYTVTQIWSYRIYVNFLSCFVQSMAFGDN